MYTFIKRYFHIAISIVSCSYLRFRGIKRLFLNSVPASPCGFNTKVQRQQFYETSFFFLLSSSSPPPHKPIKAKWRWYCGKTLLPLSFAGTATDLNDEINFSTSLPFKVNLTAWGRQWQLSGQSVSLQPNLKSLGSIPQRWEEVQ